MRVRQPAVRPLPPSSLHDKAIPSSASVLPPYSCPVDEGVFSPRSARRTPGGTPGGERADVRGAWSRGPRLVVKVPRDVEGLEEGSAR